MLAPSLGTPVAAPRRHGPEADLFDCGKHGMLTRAQIARLAGITHAAVCQRIRNGWTGASLCLPPGQRPYGKRGEVRYPTIRTAVLLARRFHDRVPTVDELRKAKPMSRYAALNWRRALREAIEGEGG